MLIVVLFISGCGFAHAIDPQETGYSIEFNPDKYSVEKLTIDGQTITFRSFENIVYVTDPVDKEYQSLNFYVPEDYYAGNYINGYNLDTAPILFTNKVAGYMPGKPEKPGQKMFGPPEANAPFGALSRGYVVASSGARGRTNQNEAGDYIGKAPAGIVDLKAAVRYLHYNDNIMPGDAEKIISNGTSAGGALSALLGATGNNKDYEPYLKEIGAADTRDDIFAVSAYCPITNLENANMAYEWLFNGLNNYSFMEEKGTLTEYQISLSERLKEMFPDYLNSLELKREDGTILRIDTEGNAGNFQDYVKSFIIDSAQNALDNGEELSSLNWITINNDTVKDIDFVEYVKYVNRAKPTPAFDDVDLSTAENELFGTKKINSKHFTDFGAANSVKNGSQAEKSIVKMMNPMYYIGTVGTTNAQHWRIRHGAIDNDTSLAIPVILATKLKNEGMNVNFDIPWEIPHAGDYDLDQLFAWIDKISK